MEYLSRGGVYTTSVEYLSTGGGGTPLQWNIYLEGEVHHLNGILIHRGGGYTTSVEYFSQPPIFPNAPFPTSFFLLGGGVPLCCMDSHSSQLSIFMMVFFVVGGCVGGGGVPDFFLSLSDRKEGRKGGGGYHTFIRLLLRCVLFYVLDTRCQIRLQTSDFIPIAAGWGHPISPAFVTFW